ncbi:MAG: asparagine synthase (glutamine-hydrolyzing), partial [Acidobacteriota bacterium]
MCGICGIVAFDLAEPINPELIRRMNDQMQHRGPDDYGYYLNNNVALGHRRLSIIDLNGGHQPISNEDDTLWIVFNGEIFNHNLLRRELELKGHIFRTNSDTEAIVHCYEEYGSSCAEKLRGMFAFAIWDQLRHQLLIVRDRLGKKPIYYYQNNKFFIFASEIKSLLVHPAVEAEIDLLALDHYLSLRYVPGPLTMFKNIFKLQPGHRLICNEKGVHVEKYWELEFHERQPRPLPEEVAEFRALLKDCVKMRLMSEVPLGVFLSGGLDSSSIVALMSELGGARIKTFSIGYQGDNNVNELGYARTIAHHFDTEHYEFQLKAKEFGDFISDLVWYMDEPIADSASIPLYFISKLAREHVTVALSGEGADEMLAGYSIYQRMLTLEAIHKFYRPIAAIAQPFCLKLAPSLKVRKYLLLAGLPFAMRYRGVSNALSDDLKQEMWALPSLGEEGDITGLLRKYLQSVDNVALLNQMLFVDTKVWLPDDLLVKADKMTMANSLELRTPFLDHVLMEYTAALPVSLKLHHGSGKFLLKAAMSKALPAQIIHRTKQGFPTPIKQWLNNELSAQTRTILLAPDSKVRSFFNIDKVSALLAE